MRYTNDRRSQLWLKSGVLFLFTACGKAEFAAQNADVRSATLDAKTASSGGKAGSTDKKAKDTLSGVTQGEERELEPGDDNTPNLRADDPRSISDYLAPYIWRRPEGTTSPKPGVAPTPIGAMPPTMTIKIKASVDINITTTITNGPGTTANPGPGGATPPGPGTSTNPGPTTTVTVKPCSVNYLVPATANPYFAGSSAGSYLDYVLTQYDPQTPTDRILGNAPVLVSPVGGCLKVGKPVYFSVGGAITFSQFDAPTNADGNLGKVVSHQKGATFGKSNITAPINSLIGVFLSESDPTPLPPPAPLDFSTQAARDYYNLSPALGQVFFIGDGKTSTGEHHRVMVPEGAARLYFAVMDIYQWNNNSGSLAGAIMVE
ncbi:MAG: hypothetical protein RL011_22 [Pseudomonadota bacterium]|jgi:hypothetical protein